MASRRSKPVHREAFIRENDADDSAKHGEREASKKQMWEGYEGMMQTYAQQQKALANRPAWIAPKTRGAQEPSDLTVTHVNHTRDLLRSSKKSAIPADNQTSNEWLEHHSIEEMKLTLKDLMDKGKIKRPSLNKDTNQVQQQLQFEAVDINEFEYKLNLAIESYTNRIKWLLQGSRRIFGVLKGTNVAVLLDSSDANLGFGRLSSYQDALVHLLDEQISQKKGIYVASFGTDVMPLWNNCMDVSSRSVEEAKSWVDRLTPSGGSNVLRALHQTIKVKNIDTILLVLGSSPDQNGHALTSYIDELTVGKGISIQTVAYDCNNPITHQTLKQLAENSEATYHNYDSANEHEIYTGSDIAQLLNEIQTAQNVINKIKDMREGLLGSALVSVMNEISGEVSKLPQSRFLPCPPGHDQPLRLEMPSFQPSMSNDWLKNHGLKATGLDLYQKLSPNAFSFKEEFIPVIKKTVQSQVYEKAMTQFQWHDGTYRNIHVDLTQLYDYQKKLGSSVKVFEKRIDWLSSASRKIFGTIAEKNVVILLDLSLSNLSYLVHMQHSMRLLLEQQMANKEYFNIITIGKEVNAWRPTMTKPTPETLQNAWKWVLDQQCDGSRNFMDALRKAVENDEENKHHIDVEGIYLFTSGIPDQSHEVIMQYLEEACCGRDRRLHVILFNVDDYDSNGAIPSRYANITKTAECLRNMAHCTSGRFHWFRETGIIESDDIALVNLEIERALNFSKKSAMLVDSVKTKYGEDIGRPHVPALPPPSHTFKALPAPNTKPPVSKYSYLNGKQEKELEEPKEPKALTWRPNSAKKDITMRQRPLSAQPVSKTTTPKKKKTQQEYFFTDDKRGAVGAVYTKYTNNKPRSARVRPIKATSIPDREEPISTKEWLRMYSLIKLKLDLNKMVLGPESKVTATNVKVIKRVAESKVFSQFPTVSVGGTLRRLQLRPQELAEYERQVEKVLQRYLRRLQWLLGGSRRVFGVVVEKKVAVLIDTSGSMMPYIDELRAELVSLVWEQLFHHRVKFNLIAFSAKCTKWRENLITPSEDVCHDAASWVSGLVAHGNTCTLDALQMAFEDKEVEAIYLLTDGKPDTSTSLVIREVAKINEIRSVHIHTISFNCEDSSANSFLKLLASENKGRYHKCHKDFDAQLFAHKLLTECTMDSDNPPMPEFEGDDLKRIGEEIKTARMYLAQSRQYRVIIEENQKLLEEQQSSRPGHSETTRGPQSSRYRPMSAKV